MDILWILVIVIVIIIIWWIVQVHFIPIRTLKKVRYTDDKSQIIMGKIQYYNIPPVDVSPIITENYGYPVIDDQTDLISLKHDQAYAIWGNFTSVDSKNYGAITAYLHSEDDIIVNKQLSGTVSSHVVGDKVCVILTANQSITTPFRDRLRRQFDLRDSAFKIISIPNLSPNQKYRFLVYSEKGQPEFLTARYSVQDVFNAPYAKAVVDNRRIDHNINFRSIGLATLDNNHLQVIEEIDVISHGNGYYITPDINRPDGTKLAVLSVDHVSAGHGLYSKISVIDKEESAHEKIHSFVTSGETSITPTLKMHLFTYTLHSKVSIVEWVHKHLTVEDDESVIPMLVFIVNEKFL